MGALNGNTVEDLRYKLAKKDDLIGGREKLIDDLYRGLIDIENAALNGLTNHRDIIYGICLKLKGLRKELNYEE